MSTKRAPERRRLQLLVVLSACLMHVAMAQHELPTTDREYCDLWESAATGDDAIAIRNLSYCYWNGVGRERDLQMAEELLRRSASLGNATAMYNLGTLLVFEDDDGENDGEGLDYLRSAIESGYGRAGFQLGLVYWSGMADEPINVDRALELFELAGANDSPQAQFILFSIYSVGMRGVPQNATLADKWLRKSRSTSKKIGIGGVTELRDRLLDDSRFLEFAITCQEKERIRAIEIS